jgi:transcription initiation factor IIE alpha subunit
MFKIQEAIAKDVEMKNNERKFVCSVCRSEYTPLQAMSLLRPEDGLFACEVCQNVLEQETPQDIENDLSKRFLLISCHLSIIVEHGKHI